MICNHCKKEYPDLHICTITDQEGIQRYCHNCLIKLCSKQSLDIQNNQAYLCEVTGEDAVKLQTGNKFYFLEKELMLRFLTHSLKPIEWKTLILIHGKEDYFLHSDFYSSTGIALQPLLD